MLLKGVYCLCVVSNKNLNIAVGVLGVISLPLGKYVYIGSALNGIKSRVRRHLNTSQGIVKAVHWHLDYLLKEPEVHIESVYTRESESRIECSIAHLVSSRGVPIPGFGCSDCNCKSHLFRVKSFKFLANIGLELKPLSYF